jgi:2'-5' RNA ligase
MRLFFAIELPEEIRTRLSEVQRRLRSAIPARVSWVRVEHLHLTVHFLGERSQRFLDVLVDEMRQVMLPSPCSIALVGLTRIPEHGRARVIAARVTCATANLNEIHQGVVNACGKAETAVGGSEAARREQERFLPHVTLGRVRPPVWIRDGELDSVIEGAWPPMGFVVPSVALIQSVLSSAGPSYRRIAEMGLALS